MSTGAPTTSTPTIESSCPSYLVLLTLVCLLCLDFFLALCFTLWAFEGIPVTLIGVVWCISAPF